MLQYGDVLVTNLGKDIRLEPMVVLVMRIRYRMNLKAIMQIYDFLFCCRCIVHVVKIMGLDQLIGLVWFVSICKPDVL